MGEYFAWVNIDKHERIEMGAFGSGTKVMEPCWVGDKCIDAVCTLLEDRWRGDTIAFCGDQSYFWPDTTGRDIPARSEYGDPFLDYAEDHFEDVAGLFKEAKGRTYIVYGCSDVSELPYMGPFDRTIQHRWFVVNHTRMLFYDRKRTPIRCFWPHQLGGDERIVRFDPFPALLAKDNRLAGFSNHKNKYFEEDWVGDAVEIVDEMPPRAYLDVSAFYDYWLPSIIADDEALLEAMETSEFKELVEAGEDAKDAIARLRPDWVVKQPIGWPEIWPYG